MPRIGVSQPADVVVVTALVDGELQCLIDGDGAIEIFEPGDPEIEKLVEAARQAFGDSARAMAADEFKALGGMS